MGTVLVTLLQKGSIQTHQEVISCILAVTSGSPRQVLGQLPDFASSALPPPCSNSYKRPSFDCVLEAQCQLAERLAIAIRTAILEDYFSMSEACAKQCQPIPSGHGLREIRFSDKGDVCLGGLQ